MPSPAEERRRLAQLVAEAMNGIVDRSPFAATFGTLSLPEFRDYTAEEVLDWLDTDIANRLSGLGVTNATEQFAAKIVFLQMFLNDAGLREIDPTVDFTVDTSDLTRTGVAALQTVILDAQADAARFPREATPDRQFLGLIRGLATSGAISAEMRDSLVNIAKGGRGQEAFDNNAGRNLSVEEQLAYVGAIQADFENIITSVAGAGGANVEIATENFVTSDFNKERDIIKPVAETLRGAEEARTRERLATLSDDFVTKNAEEAFLQSLARAELPSEKALLETKEEKAAFDLALAEFRNSLRGAGENPSADVIRGIISTQTPIAAEILRTGSETAQVVEATEQGEEARAEAEKARDALGNVKAADVEKQAAIAGVPMTPEAAQRIATDLNRRAQTINLERGDLVPTVTNAINAQLGGVAGDITERNRLLREVAERQQPPRRTPLTPAEIAAGEGGTRFIGRPLGTTPLREQNPSLFGQLEQIRAGAFAPNEDEFLLAARRQAGNDNAVFQGLVGRGRSLFNEFAQTQQAGRESAADSNVRAGFARGEFEQDNPAQGLTTFNDFLARRLPEEARTVGLSRPVEETPAPPRRRARNLFT